MKKILIVALVMFGLTGCYKDELILPTQEVKEQLQIKDAVGIKLESTFVTTEVAMNVKTNVGGKLIVRILDLTNKVVSKEEIIVKSGDNILNVYTSTLPSSAYRIALYDVNNVMLGIADFNKIN
jgi:hypothetical protein